MAKCEFPGGCEKTADCQGLLHVANPSAEHPEGVQRKVWVCEGHGPRWSALWGYWPVTPEGCDEDECGAPLPARAHRVTRTNADPLVAPRDEAACTDCKVRNLRTRASRLRDAIADGALTRRGGAATALRSVERQLAALTA